MNVIVNPQLGRFEAFSLLLLFGFVLFSPLNIYSVDRLKFREQMKKKSDKFNVKLSNDDESISDYKIFCRNLCNWKYIGDRLNLIIRMWVFENVQEIEKENS